MKETCKEEKILEQLLHRGTRDKGFSLLLDTYQEPLYWHIRKMVLSHDDAKDVLQEVFLRAWKNIDGFKGESRLFSWLFRIATNEISRFLERKTRLFKNNRDLGKKLAIVLEESPWIDGDGIQIKLQKAILSLPQKQRMVFNMRYFDEMKYEDMAEILETSVNSLKVSFHHAKTKIEEILKTEII